MLTNLLPEKLQLKGVSLYTITSKKFDIAFLPAKVQSSECFVRWIRERSLIRASLYNVLSRLVYSLRISLLKEAQPVALQIFVCIFLIYLVLSL